MPGWGKTAQQLVELGRAEFARGDPQAMEHGVHS